MIVNGKKIDTYSLDTRESLIVRIASVYKTLPKYLRFPDGFPDVIPPTNIPVENLLEIIKNNAKRSPSPDQKKI
jgi:hypothetical protein